MKKRTLGHLVICGSIALACMPGPTGLDEPKCTQLASGEICLYPRGEGAADDDETSADGSSTGGSSTDGDASGGQSSGSEDGEGGASAGAAGESSTADPTDGMEPCLTFRGVLRDFRDGTKPYGHADFERYSGFGEPGLLANELGADGRPVLAKKNPETVSSAESFDAWYRDTA